MDRTAAIQDADLAMRAAGVEGWVGDLVDRMVAFADFFHEKHGVLGDVAEIGVHHGRLFFLLAAACREGERAIALDLFEKQELNVGFSGLGARDIFTGHLDTVFPQYRDRTTIVTADSLAISLNQVPSVISSRGVRLFSVDGGHTVTHVVNDLSLAQEALVGGGVILLDDYFGPHWPSVTEGYFKFMSLHNRRLAPFMIFRNKLFLTTFSEHAMILAELREYLDRMFGEGVPGWVRTRLCDFDVLSYAE